MIIRDTSTLRFSLWRTGNFVPATRYFRGMLPRHPLT
jgi:hypothetical protein